MKNEMEALTEREKIVLKFIFENSEKSEEFKDYFKNERQAKILQDLSLRGFVFDIMRNENDEIYTANLSKEAKEYFEKQK